MSAIRIQAAIFFLLLLAFTSLSMESWVPSLAWHDAQRAGQLLLLAAVLGLFFFSPVLVLPNAALAALFIIFTAGLCSAALAQYPMWALREWGRCLALVCVVLWLGRHAGCNWAPRAVAALMLVSAGVSAGMFFIYYAVALMLEAPNLNPVLLLYGFDNPRWLGQFQVLLLPLLAWSFFQLRERGFRSLSLVVAVIALAHWVMAWSFAGRGMLLAVLASHVLLVLLARSYWRLVLWQALLAVLGGALFIVLFDWLPAWLNIDVVLGNALRGGLSAREVLWQGAWDMARSSPLLGVGPMHFSAVWNHIGAHPHQVVLQWLAEWGVVATALALMLLAWGMVVGARVIRCEQSDDLDAALWLSLLGALLLAQVDGVFVMPYTEVWLAVLAGLALARWRGKRVLVTGVPVRVAQGFSALALVALAYQLVMDVPHINEMQMRFFEQHQIGSPPRLWGQGWIPMQ